MEYVREATIEDTLATIFHLPVSYIGKRVEVRIKPIPSEAKPTEGSAFGCLQKYANPSLIQSEEGAWEKAVVEKYANS
jgi:hypothetical protein